MDKITVAVKEVTLDEYKALTQSAVSGVITDGAVYRVLIRAVEPGSSEGEPGVRVTGQMGKVANVQINSGGVIAVQLFDLRHRNDDGEADVVGEIIILHIEDFVNAALALHGIPVIPSEHMHTHTPGDIGEVLSGAALRGMREGALAFLMDKNVVASNPDRSGIVVDETALARQREYARGLWEGGVEEFDAPLEPVEGE